MTDSKISSRSDGRQTREKILQAACRVFYEKGYAQAECSEVARLAKTSIASINYHFGGKQGLYLQTLVRAHDQIISLEQLQQIGSSAAADPPAAWRAFFSELIRSTRSGSQKSLRIFMREVAAPTEAFSQFLQQQGNFKILAMHRMIAQTTGIAQDSEQAGRLTALIMAPCILALGMDRDVPGPLHSLCALSDEELCAVLTQNALTVLLSAADSRRQQDCR